MEEPFKCIVGWRVPTPTQPADSLQRRKSAGFFSIRKSHTQRHVLAHRPSSERGDCGETLAVSLLPFAYPRRSLVFVHDVPRPAGRACCPSLPEDKPEHQNSKVQHYINLADVALGTKRKSGDKQLSSTSQNLFRKQ